MSRRCELSNKAVQSGNRVSHSKRHTRHKFYPNLQSKRIWSVEKQRFFTLRVSTAALRTLDKLGLDAYLRKFGVKIK